MLSVGRDRRAPSTWSRRATLADRFARYVGGARWPSLLVFCLAALAVVHFVRPLEPARRSPFAELGVFGAAAAPDAFGQSREVKLRVALPGRAIEFPLAVGGDPTALAYQWVAVGDTTPLAAPRPLRGATVVAPAEPGYYRLALVKGGERQLMAEPTLAVLVPFAEKVGATLNGYRIGTYLAERVGGRHETPPQGFLEVRPEQIELPVSKHFRIADFITHDRQRDVWPKYVALNPRLLDKLELVLEKVREYRGISDAQLALGVHSGFRAPAHNAGVRRAARDSRHQYGDAADLVVDADGDGRITIGDELLVASAVEAVEREHPDLVGGLGLYTSRRYRTPYVHIDARGRRSRWRG